MDLAGRPVRAWARRALPGQRARTIGAFTTLTVALTTLAILHDGTEVADVELNDGGVWVTNLNLEGYAVAAHLNYPSRELDSYTEPTTNEFDVSQEANAIVVHDQAGNGIASVETTTWLTKATAKLPTGATATQGTDVVAVVDQNRGTIWAVPATETGSFDPESTAPVLDGRVGIRAVVGKDDTIHTVTPDGTLRDLTPSGEAWTTEEVGDVPAIEDGDDVVLTAVGATGVVVNRTAGWAAWPDHRADLEDAADADAAHLVVQQPGDDTGVVALSGPSGLVQLPLDGGEPVVTATGAGGEPVAPVTVGACVYAAWSGTGAFVRDCDDDSQDDNSTYEVLTRSGINSSQLVFRTNRDVVVLNDVANGDIILVDEDMVVIDNWQTILAQIQEDQKDDQDDEVIDFHREKQNHPPDAKDDEFGVRAGQPVTIPVLANDTDPDGDVLTVQLPEESTEVGELELVRNGRAVRVVVDGDADGTARFSYTADDGRSNGTDKASVSLEVRAPSANDAPRLLTLSRPSEMTIRQRGSGEHHILQEWFDPDGDPFWVSEVRFPKGTTGTFRPDGYIKVEDDGREPAGRRVVEVTLTDGMPGGTEVVDLEVTVKPIDGRTPPEANADYVTALVDEPVDVRPLRNDVDPGGDELYLELSNRTPAGLDVSQNDDASITLTGSRAGTSYVEYTASDGNDQSPSVVRVDVVEPEDARPVPDNDLGVLPQAGEVLVDVLANDTDPLGGVLVLESVNVDGVTGVTAEVVDHEVLRVRDNGMTPGSVKLSYNVSNGTRSATGQATIVLDPADRSGPPVATNDVATVRSGDVVTVDVLDNDISPGDRALTVLPKVEVTKGKGLGEAWVSEGTVRFRATGESGDVRIQYTVEDPRHNADSGTIEATIQPTSGSNAAPTPEALDARLFQGGETEILVPLEGIDPDGDSVTLLGIQQAPTKGVVEVEGGSLRYTASALTSGTDTFTYLVEDPYGAEAEGQVRIGIAVPPPTNKPPQTHEDLVRVRPDRLLAVPVTLNDIDPEGEPIALAGVEAVDGGVPAEVVDGRVQLRTPDEPGTLRFTYTVEDSVGATAEGTLEVKVDPEAPALPPVARDDRVPLAEVVGQTEVTLDVLHNDEDPDGAVSELTPAVEAKGVRVTEQGELVIPLQPERQVIVYSLEDPDGEIGKAVAVVPGTDSDAARRPVLRDDVALPITVTAGDEVEIPLDDYVAVREGREPSLPFSENIFPGPGHDGSQLKRSDDAVITFGSAKDFYGPTAVTATVSDSKGESDTDALAAVVTFPIFVEASGNTPPTLKIPEIEVAPEEPWEGDLAELATDPDPGDQENLEFEVGETDPDLDVDLGESTLTVTAGSGASPGDQPTFELTVTDGKTAPVTRQVVVQVTESTRPLIRVRSGEIDAAAGEPVEIDVDDYVLYNPFEDEGEDVSLVGAPGLVGGAGDVAVAGSTITVTPADDYSGTMTLTYVLRDATDLAEREVQGQVQLDVVGVPDAPSAPTAEPTESKTVQVDWRAGDNNGAPITGFRVEWRGGSGGSGEVKGAATTYTATGLTNAKEYYFRVIAINEVGESEPSEWSRAATPDQVPLAPTNLDLSFGDESLQISWDQPSYEGSPVRTYEIQVGSRRVTTNGERTTVVDDLANGTPYDVKVRGINDAEAINDGTRGASDWSATATEHPNGEPQVTSVAIDADGPDVDPSALISWTQEDHGHAIADYEVRKMGGEARACTAVSATSCRVALEEGERSQFQVRVFNRDNPDRGIDGWGEWSEPTAQVSGAKPPGQVTNLSAIATGVSGQSQVTFDPAPLNGAESARYEYRASNGATGPISSGQVIGGLPNGATSTITVWAISSANGKESAPGPTADDTVNAFAPCSVSVTAGTAGYHSHTFNWSVSSNGRSCRWSGSAANNAPTGSGASGSGQTTVTSGSTGTVSLRVTVNTVTSGDDRAVAAVADTASGSTWGPEVTDWSVGAECNVGGLERCRRAALTLRNWDPDRSAYCWMEGEGGLTDWSDVYAIPDDGHVYDATTWVYDEADGRYNPNDHDGTHCRYN